MAGRFVRENEKWSAGSLVLGHRHAQSGFEACQSLPSLVERTVEKHFHTLFARGLAQLIEGSPLLD